MVNKKKKKRGAGGGGGSRAAQTNQDIAEELMALEAIYGEALATHVDKQGFTLLVVVRMLGSGCEIILHITRRPLEH